MIAPPLSIGDINGVVSFPSGSPITQLFVNVTGGNAGGIALNCNSTFIATILAAERLGPLPVTTIFRP